MSKTSGEREEKKKKEEKKSSTQPIFKVPRLEDAPSIKRKSPLRKLLLEDATSSYSERYEPQPLIKPLEGCFE